MRALRESATRPIDYSAFIADSINWTWPAMSQADSSLDTLQGELEPTDNIPWDKLKDGTFVEEISIAEMDTITGTVPYGYGKHR
jgi:hypothetical protein